ncbi:MAG: PEP-CTERM sorting domain-containing protein [Phycisphaerae bacterium]
MRLYPVAAAAVAVLAGVTSAFGASATITFVQLSGVTGGSPAGTAVYRADLSGLGLSTIQSITIQDSNSGSGGAGGQFSGFDLDAIRLSNSSVGDAASAAGLAGLSGFDFGSGTIFSPGTQRPPVDPKLFGTDALGTSIDNSVATLGVFDGNSTTVIPGAAGFVSLGDGGRVTFNLTSAISTSSLFLYIGEVGDNGEVAAGTISVSDRPVVAPLPSAAWGGLGMLGVMGMGRRLAGKKLARVV